MTELAALNMYQIPLFYSTRRHANTIEGKEQSSDQSCYIRTYDWLRVIK